MSVAGGRISDDVSLFIRISIFLRSRHTHVNQVALEVVEWERDQKKGEGTVI